MAAPTPLHLELMDLVKKAAPTPPYLELGEHLVHLPHIFVVVQGVAPVIEAALRMVLIWQAVPSNSINTPR